MSIEDSVIEPIEEADLATDESVIMSMDNIELEDEKLDIDAMLSNKDAALENVDLDSEYQELVDKEDEEILIPEIDRVPTEIEELLRPLEGNRAGTDPRYGDEFVLIKTEIDKLAFNDYSAVMTLAREILKNESKDIRVAGYFLLANTYINGVKGLLDGLILYRLLLERFGDDVYPTKESARNTAMLWLNNTKLVAYVKQSRENLTLETVELVAKQIERLNEVIVSVTNDETLRCNSLNSWIKEKKKKLDITPPTPPAKAEVKKVDEPVEHLNASNNTVGQNVEPTQEVTAPRYLSNPLTDVDMSSSMSDTELYSLIRKIVNQLMSDGEYARGIAYARAARWGGFSMPPNENGKTRITPPRQTAVNQISSLLVAGENEKVLSMCEGIFFELGGHILLDLQLYAYKAAKSLGKINVANLVAFETSAFIKRFPGIEELRFDDDTPIANAECVAWLSKLSGNSQSSSPVISAEEDSAELLECINKACEEANDKDLNAGLALLNEYRPKSDKQRFQLRLAMSQLCLDHGRAELALPMLEDLTEQAERTYLAMWDVSLAMSAARQLQNALRGVMASATETNRMHYEQRINEVTAQMCRWDLAQAAQFL